MLDEYFEYKVKEIYKEFEKKYNLISLVEKNKIIYKSNTLNYIVYFEKNFEIYIVFILDIHGKKENVDLNSIVNYINNDMIDNESLSKNQVSCEKDIDYVIKKLYNIMELVLEKVINDKKLLYNAYLYQQNVNKEIYNKHVIEQMSNKLNQEWDNKNYKEILRIYENYKKSDSTIDMNLSVLQKKQIEYSRKMINKKQKKVIKR